VASSSLLLLPLLLLLSLPPSTSASTSAMLRSLLLRASLVARPRPSMARIVKTHSRSFTTRLSSSRSLVGSATRFSGINVIRCSTYQQQQQQRSIWFSKEAEAQPTTDNNDAKRASQNKSIPTFKKVVRSFYSLVHPDLFGAFPEAQEVNSKAIREFTVRHTDPST
jgi:hypothetical protein